MPLRFGKDRRGRYARWGTKGKKYHYKTPKTRQRARNLALRQARAIAYRRGYA